MSQGETDGWATADAPWRAAPMVVEAAFGDYNDHMNLAYYNVLFDRAVDAFFETLCIGETAARATPFTTYAAEAHVCYVREVAIGARVLVDVRIVDHDEKRIHLYQEMRHEDGWLAATGEVMTLSVDRRGPRVCPFPDAAMARIRSVAAAHAHLPRPERLGRSVGIPRRA